ncbi:hypothetical protein PRIPAC_72684, partial [Pristionchus pacificus]|uniref:Uncharacterized protein n=1 Tax=Pristionchus pacificus TaxID=54126 RepID=A0A2A6C5Z6_PRIPA
MTWNGTGLSLIDGWSPKAKNLEWARYSSPCFYTSETIVHSCARDGRSALTPAPFHPQFGESSSVSLGNPTSIAHLDHQEEDSGRILIVSSDLRSRKAPFKKTTSTSAAGSSTSGLKPSTNIDFTTGMRHFLHKASTNCLSLRTTLYSPGRLFFYSSSPITYSDLSSREEGILPNLCYGAARVLFLMFCTLVAFYYGAKISVSNKERVKYPAFNMAGVEVPTIFLFAKKKTSRRIVESFNQVVLRLFQPDREGFWIRRVVEWLRLARGEFVFGVLLVGMGLSILAFIVEKAYYSIKDCNFIARLGAVIERAVARVVS